MDIRNLFLQKIFIRRIPKGTIPPLCFSLTPMYTCNERPLECCLHGDMATKKMTNTDNLTPQQAEVRVLLYKKGTYSKHQHFSKHQ